LMDIIRCQGGRCSRTIALKNSHLTSRQFDEAANTLADSGQLVRLKEGRTEMWEVVESSQSAKANFREVVNSQDSRNGNHWTHDGARHGAAVSDLRNLAKSGEV